MRHQKLLPQAICMTLVLLLSVGCGAATTTATSTPTPIPATPTPTATPTTPQVSRLIASVSGLGGFVFTLNPNRTGISKVALNFSNFSCGSASAGSVVVNGAIDLENKQTWPITGGQFVVEASPNGGSNDMITITIHAGFSATFSNETNTLTGIDMITINGRFDGTGTHASGTWTVVSGGTSCPGTWESS